MVSWLSNDCLDADVSKNRWSFHVITCHLKKEKKAFLNEAAQLDFTGVEKGSEALLHSSKPGCQFLCVCGENRFLYSTRTKSGSTALILTSHKKRKKYWKSKEGREQTLICLYGTINPFLCLNTHEHFHIHSSASILYQRIPRGSIQLAVKILEKCLKIFFSFKWPEGLWRGWLSWWKEQIYMSWSISLGKRRLMCRPTHSSHSCMCWKKACRESYAPACKKQSNGQKYKQEENR